MTTRNGLLKPRTMLLTAFLVSTSCITLSYGEPRSYGAALHDADWTVKASIFECSLSQSIPQYGSVGFYQQAGESLEFRLQPFEDLMSKKGLELSAAPPPWNPQLAQRDLGSLPDIADSESLQLDATMARRLMGEMLNGMMPTFKGSSIYDEQQVMTVVLSPLHFRSAYNQYQQCSGQLLPVNFDQVQYSTVFWPSGANSLSSAAMAMLDNIVLYAQADSSIRGFEEDSFTDTAGERRENLLVSEERAFLVTNYLVRRGIDSETIATRAHGEREEYLIVNPEKSQADHDRNRRVNIVMLRGRPQQATADTDLNQYVLRPQGRFNQVLIDLPQGSLFASLRC